MRNETFKTSHQYPLVNPLEDYPLKEPLRREPFKTSDGCPRYFCLSAFIILSAWPPGSDPRALRAKESCGQSSGPI